MEKISVVINTLNEEKNLSRAISSIKSLADEIIVVDMYSEDRTVEIAKKLGAKVFQHEKTGYVEPARNFAISKASGNWILILDADEEIPSRLAKELKNISLKPEADYFRIPRKNIVFAKWLKHSRWWPDYNIRFFKKGHVTWSEVIHSVPMTTGEGIDLADKEEFAIIHHHYDSIQKYLEIMDRYTSVQSEMLAKKGYKFIWKDLVKKPTEEFLSRYFFGDGYKDGLHGLALSALQAFSEFILYLKVWESEKFLEQYTSLDEIKDELGLAIKNTKWWIADSEVKSKSFLSSLPARITRKLLSKNA